MNVEFDESVVGSDHGQPRGGHSEVESKAEHYVQSKGRFVNGGKHKQIGSGRGSPRAQARDSPVVRGAPRTATQGRITPAASHVCEGAAYACTQCSR